MQTKLADFIKDTEQGKEAQKIIATCVHCGFCTATCPTYQLIGDELDSPRGRIYLIKNVLEGKKISYKTQQHLDRCLTCRACETTCPSGVNYGRLLDIGREVVEGRVSRSFLDRILRKGLCFILPYSQRFKIMLKISQIFSPLLPKILKEQIPIQEKDKSWPKTNYSRKMLILDGCVQSALAPNINTSTAWVLDQLGVSLVSAPNSGCCGAINQHLSDPHGALHFIKKNIDAWWPYIERGAEAIVITASGCGVMVKEYGILLKSDPIYADKAAKVAKMTKDISEIIAQEDITKLTISSHIPRDIAFQSPCTLQHGQKLAGVVERILKKIGFNLTKVTDPHLCCGSAGTYSILQKELSQKLLKNKLHALEKEHPKLIATANIGCLTHLQSRASVPVRHWISLLDPTNNV
ncbi:glycolate oxidase subunit GlcF [Candidatus Nitrosacidococcus tergens]|uniref:Glycolate oxidase iron-sulfur subunit n=1 Tax=Candidatus Nitrosacidococcus tergens TaxID=553981 RepID=A0A7G1Q993_9GAMM|nr:glycolate oxidase subunit GlcF [Candidatus Nitrosacidococcus tergens]CAB1275683.1 glycolate oxidase iron-sulfur subunit [Candidatus Nitrosacidococcus tergens]